MFHVVKTSNTGEVIETIFSEPTRGGAQAMLLEAQAGPPLQPGHHLKIIELDDEGGDDSDLDDDSNLDDEEN